MVERRLGQFDFDDLSAVWQGESPRDLPKELLVLSTRAIRRAKALAALEIAVTACVIGCVLLIQWHVGTAKAAVAGAVIIVVVLWSTWDRHRLRRIEWARDERQREAVVAQGLLRLKARLRRTTVGVLLFPIGILLGWSFADVVDPQPGAIILHSPAYRALGAAHHSFLLLIAVLVAVVAAGMVWSLIGQRRQIGRMSDIMASYRAAAGAQGARLADGAAPASS